MFKSIFSLLCLAFTTLAFSQITGNVTSTKNEALTAVNIFLENTYTGTTTNNEGNYTLELNTKGTHTVVFQYLGFKTVKKKVDITAFPFELNMVLEEQSTDLDEVVLNSTENPANAIIRSAIAKRKANLERQNTFTSNFYSRGLIKLLKAPEKILGQEVGDLDGNLDSTRQGIIYLSETVSKLEYQYPKALKETIIASKVSGDNNGFSFNNASDVNFNFYKNTFELGEQIVSPIASSAFGFYNYKLVGGFFDEEGHYINKIKLTPKRKNDKAFSGIIYIVEDDWSIYGVDVTITGQQTGIAPVNFFHLKQTYSYSKKDDIWAKISQIFDFNFGFFGFEGEGTYSVVYSEYDFKPNFDKKNFTREILSFEDNANKKDSLYWNTKRPIPLTQEEASDYVKKDSIEILRKSKPYLDSIDRKNNKFKLGDVIGGYTYNNSHKKYRVGFTSPLDKISFNTVQGWNSNLGVFYSKRYDDYKRFMNIDVTANYGEADDRLRATGRFYFKFNSIKRNYIQLKGGIKTEQFNSQNPISRTENLVSTLLFEDNYMKLYDKTFVQASYGQELFNGVNIGTNIAYEKRKPLFNNSNYVLLNDKDDVYFSNNPLDKTAYNTPSFKEHNMLKFNVNTRINFAQNYLSYPDGKYNVNTGKFPTLYLGYEKGFNASKEIYNFDEFKIRLTHSVTLGAMGKFRYNLKGGLFSNADDIAFMDYKHFNGNEIHLVTDGNYNNSFKNLPYYSLSTNKNYAEAHLEHNFKGYILNKIPLLSKLNFNLIAGAKLASSDAFKPYTEFSLGVDNLGFGKYRFLRVDYVRSYQSGFLNDAVMFGISF